MYRFIMFICITCLIVVTVSIMYSYRDELNKLRNIRDAQGDIINNQQGIISSYKNIIVKKEEKIEKLKELLDVPVSSHMTNVHTDSFVITAYSPYDDKNGLNSDGSPNTTATGTKPRPGTFAVDPKVIPYGSTIVIVYEDGTMERGIAEDTGGKIKGNRIDVFRYKFNTATRFGKREAVVLWYKETLK